MSSVIRYLRGQAIAVLALCVALGGTSYAAVKISGKQIKNESITSADLKNGSVTGNDVKDGSLGTGDLAAGTLLQGPKGDKGDKGDTGDAGPAGPTGRAFSAFHDTDVSVPNAPAPVGQLAVTAPGAYFLIANATVTSTIAEPTPVDCAFTAVDGTNVDSDRQVLRMYGTVLVNLTSTVVHDFAAGGLATLTCSDDANGAKMSNIKITAVPVGALTNSGF